MTKPYIKTLDDTSWALYDIIGPIGTGTNRFELDFTVGEDAFSSITFEGTEAAGTLYFGDTAVVSYPACVWADADYKKVVIAGGKDATNPRLLAWFSSYGRNMNASAGDDEIVDALKDIATAIEASGSDIPDPSTANVGDVLTKGEDRIGWSAPSGGMPADYPYEAKATTLFEGSVEYADEEGDIEELTLPIGKPLTITINGVTTDLFWIEEEGLWSDIYPFVEANVNIVLFSDPEEDYTALYIKDAPDGTYAVKIEGDGINENFENAVKEIAGGLVVHATHQVEEVVLSETFRTIKSALANGKTVMVVDDVEQFATSAVTCSFSSLTGIYTVNANVSYTTDSEDGYPTDSGK